MTDEPLRSGTLPPLSSEMLIAAAADLRNAGQWLEYGTIPPREHSVAAPLALDLLDHVVPVVQHLATFADGLGPSLRASLTEYEVFEDDETRDPVVSVDQAEPEFARAGRLLREAAEALAVAKKAIGGQSHDGLRDA
ncbi:hypothetical protein ACFWUU_40355 [Kribbella sp. NPDC058693]|uniref:hypothetical protein n=1 Tax=Kribbella sp. NPDC058693 TaxID=3346602 RepID=UPI0036583ABB